MKKLFGILLSSILSLTPKKALAWGVAIIAAGVISAALEIDYMEYATDGAAQSAWVSSDTTPLQSYSESTIKTQGSYALKLEATTDALNETVTKTLTGGDILDLTGKNTIKLDARSTGTGSNLEMNIRDSGNENSGNLFIEAETDITDKNGTHTITPVGTAALSKAQFSGYNNSIASVLLDGNSDYLTVPDHVDWYFNTGNFTVDFFVYFGDATGERTFIDGTQGVTAGWLVDLNVTAGELRLYVIGTGSVISKAWAPSNSTWYHVALIRTGNDFKFFIDGTQLGTTVNTSVTIGDSTEILQIGCLNSASRFLNGYLDNIRITKGTALWTSNFTPSDTTLLYPKYQTHTINISSADTYQTDSWDISGVADADKNAIDQIQLKVLNAGSARDFYLDNIYAE